MRSVWCGADDSPRSPYKQFHGVGRPQTSSTGSSRAEAMQQLTRVSSLSVWKRLMAVQQEVLNVPHFVMNSQQMFAGHFRTLLDPVFRRTKLTSIRNRYYDVAEKPPFKRCYVHNSNMRHMLNIFRRDRPYSITLKSY